jgi:DNA-binding response OmpR family regulator
MEASSTMAHVLILDDGRCETDNELAGPLASERHRVTCARSARDAIAQLDREMPDLIVVPIPMLGAPAAPLIGELADRAGDSRPAVAFYWNRAEEGDAGGPNAFGSCWYVARATEWEQTHERLMRCIGQGPALLHVVTDPAAALRYAAA